MENNKKQAYYKVIDYINEQVLNEKLGKGDRVPSERDMVELLGIGRNSIREALKILDILGVVDRRQGEGTFIKDRFDKWFSKPMSVAIMLSDTSKKEIFEFRNMIEVEIASLAAERITDDEIKELTECYDNMINTEDQEISTEYDMKFHSILAKASKNIIIINSYNAMDYMLDLFIYEIRVSAFSNEGSEIAARVHKDLYRAVIARNPILASKAMKEHMEVIRRYYH
jgi:GntR family transcriptional repressor for pyruvate dehydrogenase complex